MNQPIRSTIRRLPSCLLVPFLLVPVQSAPAQEVQKITSPAELETWLKERWAELGKKHPEGATIALFPPLTKGQDATKVGSSPAGEYVVELIQKTVPAALSESVVSGDELVVRLGRFHWGGGDYRKTTDAEFLGAAAGCDVSIAGNLEKTPTGARLDLVAYENGAVEGKTVTPLFKRSFELEQSRSKTRDPAYSKFLKDLTTIDGPVRVPFGMNPGAASGQRPTDQDCELLFPEMLKLLVETLKNKMAARKIEPPTDEAGKLAIFPILHSVTGQVRQLTIRVDQAFQEGFQNVLPPGDLHALLVKDHERSVTWYAVEAIEPQIVEAFATRHKVKGFLRGRYTYVKDSGRVLVTLNYSDDKGHDFAVKRTFCDQRMADWMNRNLEKEPSDGERETYTFVEPEIQPKRDLHRAVASVTSKAVELAINKLQREKKDPRKSPFYFQPTLIPGGRADSTLIKQIAGLLDKARDRAIAQGIKGGLTADDALQKIPVTIAGTEFPCWQAAYLRIIEHQILCFEVGPKEMFKRELTETAFNALAKDASEGGPSIPGLDVVIPPSLQKEIEGGDFSISKEGLIVCPQVEVKDKTVEVLVRILQAANPSRVFAMATASLHPRIGALLVAPLTAEGAQQAVPDFSKLFKAPLDAPEVISSRPASRPNDRTGTRVGR